jgi:hypothetical protein
VADFIFSLNHVATPIKLAWILWLVWAVVQVGWYRRARIALPVTPPMQAPWPQPEPRRSVEKIRHVEERHVAPQPQPAEPADTYGGGFISLGLAERRSPDVEQAVG